MQSGCKTKQVVYNSTENDCTVYSRKPEYAIIQSVVESWR